MAIVKSTPEIEAAALATIDWAGLRALTDDEIDMRADADPDAQPFTDQQLEAMPMRETSTTIMQIVLAPGERPPPGTTDWDRLAGMSDSDVLATARADTDAPPQTREELRQFRPAGQTKKLVSLRLDRAVIDRFRETGPGWQTRINQALRATVGL